MSDRYIYQGPPPEMQVNFGPLPEGDYHFSVLSGVEPYYKNDKWILPLKILIQPQGVPVFANPWTGRTSSGEKRDEIAKFLLAVGRVPAVGQEPQWAKLLGAQGRCHLKVEIAQMGALAGKEVNKVAYFHRPKELENQLPKVGPTPPEDKEPDDLPF